MYFLQIHITLLTLLSFSVSFCLRRLNWVHTQFHRWTEACNFSGLSVWEQRAVPKVSIKACVSPGPFQEDLCLTQEISKEEFLPVLIWLLKTLKHMFLQLLRFFFSMCLLNLSLTLTSLKRHHMLCSHLLKLNISLLVPWTTQIQIILLLCCWCYCSENQDIALGSRISFYLEVAHPALIMFPFIFDCLKKKVPFQEMCAKNSMMITSFCYLIGNSPLTLRPFMLWYWNILFNLICDSLGL